MTLKLDELEEAIKHCIEVAKTCEMEVLERSNLLFSVVGYEDAKKRDLDRKRECASEHRQLAEWLKELKWYREDTRFADLYERICIKRDEDRDYFARTKDQTYITRIAEKEMFIHMMQDMMFDRYGVEEVNADGDSD